MQPSRAAISSYHLKGSHWFLSNTCYIVDKIRVSHVNKISNHSTSLFHELQLCFICQKVSEKVRDNCRTWIARATFSALKHWRIWIGNINGKTLKAESSLSYVSNNQRWIQSFCFYHWFIAHSKLWVQNVIFIEILVIFYPHRHTRIYIYKVQLNP